MLQKIQRFRVLIQFSCLVQVISIATSNGEAMRKLPSLAASSSISSLSYAQSTTSLHLSSGLITTCKCVHIIHCGRGKGHICLINQMINNSLTVALKPSSAGGRRSMPPPAGTCRMAKEPGTSSGMRAVLLLVCLMLLSCTWCE